MKVFRTLSILLALVATMSLSSCNYNTIVEQEMSVEQAWAEVENQYQRRMDLIPNLVNTVKGYTTHESETLQKVVEARAKATSITIDADNLDEATLEQFQQVQGELSSALKSLLAVTEAYPDLKANQNFKELQAQLEGTENRISVERRNFNETARSYNTAIRTFPRTIIAGMCGFEKRPYFEAEEGANKAPEVKF